MSPLFPMKYKLVCFDVDGTLVDNLAYSWQMFHDYFKTDPEKREKAKKRFYNGEISYLEWAQHDIDLWIEKGATKSQFWDAMEKTNIKLMNGALEVIKKLKKEGYKLAIISGTINIVLEHLLPDYESLFDDIYLSRIYFDKDGKISKVEATEFDMAKKADALRKIAEKEKISLAECVFIGDHHNDVEIAKEAGLSIAFDAKDEELRKVCDIIVDKKDLREILKFIS
jgi:phosphoserine phosphatase